MIPNLEFFGPFGQGVGHLDERHRIRHATEEPHRGVSPGFADRLLEAAARVGNVDYYDPIMSGRDLGIDPAEVAVALAQRAGELLGLLEQLLASDLGRVAAATEARPEFAFLCIAGEALLNLRGDADGLDARCEDLRQALNSLEDLLHASREVGPRDEWSSPTTSAARLMQPAGAGPVDRKEDDR